MSKGNEHSDDMEVVRIVDAATEGGATDWGSVADALIERSSHDLTPELTGKREVPQAPAVTIEVVPNALERGQGFSVDGGKTWHAYETCDVGPTLTRVVREDGAFCFVDRGGRVLAQKIHDEAFADAIAAHEVALAYTAIETGQYWRVRENEPGAGAILRVSYHDGVTVWYHQNSGHGELKSVEIDTFRLCLEPVPGTMRGA